MSVSVSPRLASPHFGPFLEFFGMPPQGLGRPLRGGWPGRKPRLAGRPWRGDSLLHAAVPLARLTASFTLAEREAGGSGPISHSQLMESEPGVGVSHPACSSWTTCGSGPHVALVQGMSVCMLSQGGDSWAPALQEMGVGLLHIKNLLRKLSGMIPMFLPQ